MLRFIEFWFIEYWLIESPGSSKAVLAVMVMLAAGPIGFFGPCMFSTSCSKNLLGWEKPIQPLHFVMEQSRNLTARRD
jgi:hypothetical protein